MKLVRYGRRGEEKPGVLDSQNQIRSLASKIDDIAGKSLSPEAFDELRDLDFDGLPEVEESVRLGPCVGRTGKILCIGLNYADHAKETGAKPPQEPVLFMKATSAIAGPNDPIVLPRGSEQTDWEVELGVVIGTSAKYVDEESALDYVAGYCVANDVSERSFQKDRGGQWTKGKSCDSFAPIGPWLVTTDEITDPQNLHLWLEVDGHRYQDGSTATMIFPVKYLVSYLSQFMTLQPGDIIFTGTPPGVGLGKKPPVFLEPDQNVQLGIDGLGEQHHVTAEDE